MEQKDYRFEEEQAVFSPALLYYEEIIRQNTEKTIRLAGGAGRLWPHVKTHKMQEMIRMQMAYGISRFKCATIAEAETAADCKAPHILLSYPLVGPNAARFFELMRAYPDSAFYTIADDLRQLALFAAAGKGAGAAVLADVNPGMDRTGVDMDGVYDFYRKAAVIGGIRMAGLHCYDGNNHDPGRAERDALSDRIGEKIEAVRARLKRDGVACDAVVAGGTPSFACHAKNEGWFVSPGTSFVSDWSYYRDFRDLDMQPGAAILTRVVSHPKEGHFTLDLGSKGISADKTPRGVIVGMEDAKPLRQSEEHWVFEAGRAGVPAIGTALYVIPSHVCPTTSLYSEAVVIREGRAAGRWKVAARNRMLCY